MLHTPFHLGGVTREPWRDLPNGRAARTHWFALSDPHGASLAFSRLLEERPPDARLIVLGDIIDRGPGGLEILRRLDADKDALLLHGNHELLAWCALRRKPTVGSSARRFVYGPLMAETSLCASFEKNWQAVGKSPIRNILKFPLFSAEFFGACVLGTRTAICSSFMAEWLRTTRGIPGGFSDPAARPTGRTRPKRPGTPPIITRGTASPNLPSALLSSYKANPAFWSTAILLCRRTRALRNRR